MIICKYSTIEMYNKWKNGIPISEIVKENRIKRKTLNKRFERLEKKLKTATNGSSALNNENNINYGISNIGDSGDNSANDAENVARGKGDIYDFWWLILIVGIILIVVFLGPPIYDKIMNRWTKKD